MDTVEQILFKKAMNIREQILSKLPEGSVVPRHTESEHFYEVPGGNVYPSVTGKLDILNDPSVGSFKMNRSNEYLLREIEKIGKDASVDGSPAYTVGIADLQKLVVESKNEPTKIFHDAGDIGTRIHDRREEYFRAWRANGERPDVREFMYVDDDKRIWSAMRALDRFCEVKKYIPIVSELYVYNHKLKLAGSLDDIGLLDGKLCLLDLKTSNQFKDKYFYQIALYYMMFRKLTGLTPRTVLILKVSKEDGSYKIEELKKLPQLVKYAKMVVQMNDGLELIKGLRKDNQKEVIKL